MSGEMIKEDKVRNEFKWKVWQATQPSSPSPTTSSVLTQSPAMPSAKYNISNEDIQRQFKCQVQQQAKKIVPSTIPWVSGGGLEQDVAGRHTIVGENRTRAIQDEFKRKVIAAASDGC